MANAVITYLEGYQISEQIQAEPLRPLGSETVSYTTTTRTNAFPEGTKVITVALDGTKAYLKVGDSTVTVGTSDAHRFLPANTVATYVLNSSDTHLALYDGSS